MPLLLGAPLLTGRRRWSVPAHSCFFARCKYWYKSYGISSPPAKRGCRCSRAGAPMTTSMHLKDVKQLSSSSLHSFGRSTHQPMRRDSRPTYLHCPSGG